MEVIDVPPMFFVSFAAAFVFALGMLVGVALIIKRLGMTWISEARGSRTLADQDVKQLKRFLWGREAAPERVAHLVWAVRMAFVATTLGLVGAVVFLVKAA